MCNAWRKFAVRLGLERFIPTIIGFRENNKLKILFDVWKDESLETYNVDILKNILSKEVENIKFNIFPIKLDFMTFISGFYRHVQMDLFDDGQFSSSEE